MKKKSVALLLALVLVFGMAVGGTIAWLMDSTAPVVNTFTVGDIEITLTEEAGTIVDGKHQFKVTPGVDFAKDPKVTVLKDSEKCWLFVTVEESANWNSNMTYGIAAGWTKLEDGVYYRIVEPTTKDEPFYVLAGDDTYPNGRIVVSGNLSSDEMEAMETSQPTLTFKAYAIQYESFEPTAETPEAIKTAAAAAWAQAKNAPAP